MCNSFYNMRCLVMFMTAVCLIFLLKYNTRLEEITSKYIKKIIQKACLQTDECFKVIC